MYSKTFVMNIDSYNLVLMYVQYAIYFVFVMLLFAKISVIVPY